MLTKIHSLAKGFGAKLLLALLVLSFAVWGIEDMIRTPPSKQVVATVGKEEITTAEFRRSLARETERIRNALGENYSPEILKSLNIPEQLLQQMTGQLLLTQEVQSLGLKVSDDDIARILRNNPAFHDEKGNFDKNIFRRRLASMGLAEKTYLDQLRRQESTRLVIEAISVKLPVMAKAAETIYLSRNQQRDVGLYIIDTSLVSTLAKPEKKEIEEFYLNNPQHFRVPEYRTLSYATFTSEEARKNVSVSEEELQAAYEERIDEFRVDEKRTVEQLLFSSKEKAEEAKAMADKGTSFSEIAKTLNAINKNSISLGSIDRSALFDSAVDSVFSMKANDVSDTVQSPFGWHIFRVVSIEPSGTTPLEKVRAALEKDIRLHKIDEAVSKLATSIEDTMASGVSLSETAKTFGLKLHTLPKIDAAGKSPRGEPVNLPALDKFLEIAFKLDEKMESSVTFSKEGTYYVVYVDDIEAEHASPLEEVETKATILWQKAEREKQLAELVGSQGADLFNKEKFLGFVKKHNLSPKIATGVKRSDGKIAGYDIPPVMMADIFVRKEQDVTLPYQIKEGTYAIAMVTQISPAKLPADKKAREEALNGIRDELSSTLQNELTDQYMSYLATKYPVHIETNAQTMLDE